LILILDAPQLAVGSFTSGNFYGFDNYCRINISDPSKLKIFLEELEVLLK